MKNVIKKILNEELESKWNVGNKYGNKYDYQHGYCHYFAYNIIGRLRKLYPNKNIRYYLILADEVYDFDEGEVEQSYLIHAYIKIDNLYLDSNGFTTESEIEERADDWYNRQLIELPEDYRIDIWHDEYDEIPDMFFNNNFCNKGMIQNDVNRFLSHPDVKELLQVNLKESLLRESAGVSFVVREWSQVLFDKIMEAYRNGEDRVILDGYEYPNIYERFPVDYFVVDFYDEFTGYDVKKSGYDKDGYYVVLLYIQPRLLSSTNNYTLDTALNHELKHAYQDYMRISKGSTNIDNTKESKEFYTDDFIGLLNSHNMNGPIKTILKFYYYLSNLERDAYLENVYDKNPEYERHVREVLNTDFNNFNTEMLQHNWNYVSKLNIPLVNRFKTPEEFVSYSEKRLKSEAEKIIKKINKLKYIHNK